jgi:hypothetical protein
MNVEKSPSNEGSAPAQPTATNSEKKESSSSSSEGNDSEE